MDKHKNIEILLEQKDVVKYGSEVVLVAENNIELFNDVYREISEKMGMDTAISIYEMFKGQQVCFPVRLHNPAKIHQLIVQEYDGTNIKALAIKYNYSEKSVQRIIRESLKG